MSVRMGIAAVIYMMTLRIQDLTFISLPCFKYPIGRAVPNLKD